VFSLSPSRRVPFLRLASLGQGVILDQRVIASTNLFYSQSYTQISVIKFESQFVIKFNFQSILFIYFLYEIYYTLLLQ
jgi:hypothetical protein